ncbi:MAG: hypothetical protein QNJ46_25820 [Leptolyngbyaceae cyanobacterium MO_188.B28]|nr:hypothetical protein [Leptolyngbyaceae cyanobacterium MO_188.B28]
MFSAKNRDPVNQFFELAKETLHSYQSFQEGKLIVDCKRLSNRESKPEFKVFLPGSPYSSFYFTPKELERYGAYRQLQSIVSPMEEPLYKVEEPLQYLEQSIFEIFRTTGYGSVVLEFKRSKKTQTTFICAVTISHQGRISYRS